jgi:transcriptional regulator with XRE-family HTH domain
MTNPGEFRRAVDEAFASGGPVPVGDPSRGGGSLMANHLGDNVRRLREARRWSQCQLARKSGVSQAMICFIERGDRGGSAKSIGKLADALGAEVSSLMFPRTCGTCGGAPGRGLICQECGSAGEPPARRAGETGAAA